MTALTLYSNASCSSLKWYLEEFFRDRRRWWLKNQSRNMSNVSRSHGLCLIAPDPDHFSAELLPQAGHTGLMHEPASEIRQYADVIKDRFFYSLQAQLLASREPSVVMRIQYCCQDFLFERQKSGQKSWIKLYV